MNSILTVTTPASDLSLLSAAELRAAAGVSGGSRDVDLKILGARIAATIARVCKVAASGANPPTLREEVLSETFRLGWQSRPEALVLARRPVSAVSVTEDGTALGADADYEIDAGAGMLYRLCGDQRTCWRGRKIVVAYNAGWETVPDDLKRAAARLVQYEWGATTRDPSLKSEESRASAASPIGSTSRAIRISHRTSRTLSRPT